MNAGTGARWLVFYVFSTGFPRCQKHLWQASIRTRDYPTKGMIVQSPDKIGLKAPELGVQLAIVSMLRHTVMVGG